MNNLQTILDTKKHLRQFLYAWGFLFSSTSVSRDDFPFYGTWSFHEIGNYKLLVSPQQKCYKVTSYNVTFILIGHAYNPISGETNELEILNQLADLYQSKIDLCWSVLNQLTGIFTLLIVESDTVHIVGDACCIQATYYTESKTSLHISTHPHLLADILGLQMDSYVKQLKEYRFFPLLGSCLPGNISPYKEAKRLVPNHYVTWKKDKGCSHKRFFTPVRQNLTSNAIADQVAELLSASMDIIPSKWEKPAISMTGGCDSKTTLSCTCKSYHQYTYFSYISSESEEVDAVAAQKICKSLNLPHTIHNISSDDKDFPDIEDIRAILFCNTDALRQTNKNDVRKRCYFTTIKDFDVEVKSWCSEIGRAYFSKRFAGRTNFGKIATPRKCTTLYKFFLHNRNLVRKTDAIFKEYLENFFQQNATAPIPWQDQFFWEFRVPAWNAGVITGEHRFSFDITIPYNNRIILQLLLSASDNEKIADTIYSLIRQKMNPGIDQTGPTIVNLKHTNNRARFENLYYILHSVFPL